MTAAKNPNGYRDEGAKTTLGMVPTCALRAKTYCKEIDHDTQRQIARTRLKCSPASYHGIGQRYRVHSRSIVNLSDSQMGDFFKKTEKLLLMACLGYLKGLVQATSQRTIGNLISLLDAALPKDSEPYHRQPFL